MDRITYEKGIEELKARGFDELNLIEPPEIYVENFIREYPIYDSPYITNEIGDTVEAIKEQYGHLAGKIYRSSYEDRERIIAWNKAIRRLNYDIRTEKFTTKEDIEFQYKVIEAIESKVREEGILP